MAADQLEEHLGLVAVLSEPGDGLLPDHLVEPSLVMDVGDPP